MNDFISKLTGASFLNEPYWRWFIFAIVMTCFLTAWSGVIKEIKG